MHSFHEPTKQAKRQPQYPKVIKNAPNAMPVKKYKCCTNGLFLQLYALAKISKKLKS